MPEVYAVMKDSKVIRMFESLDEAISYLKEFPYEERKEFEIWKQIKILTGISMQKAEAKFKTVWRFIMSGGSIMTGSF